MNYNKVEFIKSAADTKGFIKDGLPQIAFAGRSNAGKSSVINRVLNRKGFARVSATPGKTAHVNYFAIEKKVYFADLPGYGFAKVPDSEKRRWAKLMESYFAAGFITFGVLVVDIRRNANDDDRTMVTWFENAGCPYVVLANKCDKLSPTAGNKRVEELRAELGCSEGVQIIRFSAEKGEGKDKLVAMIEASVNNG